MEKMPVGIFSVWELSLGTLSLYLEMSERGERTQGVGEYCRRGVQWTLSNWNSEIPPIIGVAGGSMDFCHLLLVHGVGNLERPVF
jgi:hypothetical protein